MSLLSASLVAVLVFGLFTQDSSGSAMTFSPRDMQHNMFFVAIFSLIMVSLAFAVVHDFRHFSWKKLPVGFIHLSMFILISASIFGGSEKEKVEVNLAVNSPVMHPQLPFSLELQSVEEQDYPRGAVSSVLIVADESGSKQFLTEVNHPAYHQGWYLYQINYDSQTGSSGIDVIKDRFYLFACFALWTMLLAAAAFLFLSLFQNKTKFPKGPVSIFSAIYIAFICVNFIAPNFFNADRVAVLHSPWFTPHIVAYMAAYSLLGVALICAIFLKDNKIERCDLLVKMGYTFMTMGICMGALWAKVAWGDYWSWDPKETWAFATMLAFALYIHLRHYYPHKQKMALVLLAFAFILLNICWWGINYLPSAQGSSIHLY